ncbi:hypothetical protein CRE_29270 [Caenorhabditis remanei]|uniref:Uncharacterized protein n=1 Tax=Caenorhabditis remanei TaxID=31234 RepID=E3NQ08_CAERE|nr:hypothetical protein CRE_29270 [Caenorhabditis remanei]
MAEKEEDGPKSKDDAEKSVVPVIPETSEDNIVEKDEKKIEEKCKCALMQKKIITFSGAAKSRKKKEEKCEFWDCWVLGRSEITVDFETSHTFSAPKSVVSCETPSKNERRRKKRIEKGNLGGLTPKIPFLLEISPEKLVVPPSEPLEVTIKNPTQDTQSLCCTFDSYYFLVDFKDAKSSGQQGVTPAAAYGCYELGPGESCSLTVRTTDREIDQSVDLKTLMEGSYNVIKPFAHLPRLKDRSNIIDISFYNHKRPEGFLRFEYRKKEKRTNAKWVVRKQQLHLTDDIQEMIRLEDEKTKEKEKDNDGTKAVSKNETTTDPNSLEYMKFYRMKLIYDATRSHQKWRASWGEQLRNDDEGTYRVFYVPPDFVVDQFVWKAENYNQTLGTKEENAAFWRRIFVKEDIRDNYGRKEALLDRNVGFGKHDFTAETLEESLEKAEKFLEDQSEEYRKKFEGYIEKEQKNKKEREELEKEEELKTACEIVQPLQPVKVDQKVDQKEEKKEEKKKKKKNPCCSIC